MDNVSLVAELILKSERIVVLSGAGISTESGIPDFRSYKSGLWNHFPAEDILYIENFRRNPEVFYNFALQSFDKIFDAKPNSTHYLLARMERKGKLKAVITQNIDNLHQNAGSTSVIELHGNYLTSTCIKCGRKYRTIDLFSKYKMSKTIPLCTSCYGLIKPDVIFFGEMLPEIALNNAFKESKSSDLFIIVGSSIVVSPASFLPEEAHSSGAKVIILNMEPTSYDKNAEVVINDKLSNITTKLEQFLYV